MTVEDIKKMQRKEAAEKKRKARQALHKLGVSTKGQLLRTDKWRALEMGDKEKEWKKKLAFIPLMQVRKFGEANLKNLQQLQDRLVAVMRLRGGATTTKKHQKGRSLGRTVVPGGPVPRNAQERTNHHSGTIQLKCHTDCELRQLQTDVTVTLTACIEEAFGHLPWYKAAKEAFKNVPENRRLPDSSLPGSNIWWNWNVNKSTSHIDANAIGPCFVLTPYTYNGGELLCGANNIKMPMVAGQVVAGVWQRFPHCSDKLFGGDRYSFVVYFDYRMLNRDYWIK